MSEEKYFVIHPDHSTEWIVTDREHLLDTFHKVLVSVLLILVLLHVGVMRIARFNSNHLLTSSLIYFFGGFCNGKMVCYRYQEES